DHLRAAAAGVRAHHGRTLRRRLSEPLGAALRRAPRHPARRHAGGPDRARAMARADRRARARRPRAGSARRRPAPRDARGLLSPARPHREGEGAARPRVSRARRTRRAAAAGPRRAREPRRGRRRPAGGLSRDAQPGARRRVVALPARRDRRHLAPGRDDETVGSCVRVLFLATRLPVPPWRGDQVRAYHHLRLLAPAHDITCCALLTRPPPAALRAEVEALGVRLVVVTLGMLGAVPALARVLVGDGRPLQVLLYARRRAATAVTRLVARGGFDVVHAQLVRAASYLPAGVPAVVDLIDALSANFARRAASDRGPLGAAAAWEARRLARFEPRVAAGAARVLVVSEAERAALGEARVTVVPNGVDTVAFPYREDGRLPGRIVFAGNLGYFPNVDAARRLARDRLPPVRPACLGSTCWSRGAARGWARRRSTCSRLRRGRGRSRGRHAHSSSDATAGRTRRRVSRRRGGTPSTRCGDRLERRRAFAMSRSVYRRE